MKNFIQLTRPNGAVFMANINYIVSVSNIEGEKPNENTYVFGLGNNGGCFVTELYDQILTLIENAQ
jgi:hypothetical protein